MKSALARTWLSRDETVALCIKRRYGYSEEQVYRFSAQCIGEIPNLILETSFY